MVYRQPPQPQRSVSKALPLLAAWCLIDILISLCPLHASKQVLQVRGQLEGRLVRRIVATHLGEDKRGLSGRIREQ